MTQITSIDELMQLQPGDKFYVIKGSDGTPYIFSSIHPKVKEMVVAIKDGDYTQAVCFSKFSFSYKYNTFWVGAYDSKVMGTEKIKQLREQIESIETIYIKS